MAMVNSSPSFWKTACIYGGLAGFLIISWMLLNFTFFGFHSGAGAMVTGFLIMFFILSLIFFGIKKFRDQAQGGVIKFSKAFLLGLAMSMFAGFAYVIISEVYMAMTDYQFIQAYTDYLIELEKAKGVSGQELTAFTEKIAKLRTDYARPLYRIPLTFTEIFPMGVIVTLVSALKLHKPKFWARG